MLPYELIQKNPERKWHRQLLDRLATPGIDEDEIDTIADCLERLNDYRTVQPLLAILINAQYSPAVRERAAYVLVNIVDSVPSAVYRPWFVSNDPVLLDAFYTFADWTDVDLILPIANDPAHSRYKNAIGKLAWFEQPEYQALIINSLHHPDPEVRTLGADTLLWDEPLAALEPLLDLTEDSFPAVVEAACDTLQYYPTQLVYKRVKDIAATHVEPKVRAQAQHSIDEIRWGLLRAIDDDTRRPHLRRWLDPIWDELEVTQEELTPSESGTSSPPKSRRVFSIQQIDAFLDDLDTSPNAIRNFFWEVDWLAVPEEERRHLVNRFISHPDHSIRDDSTMVLEAWQHIDGLVALFHDPMFLVRKSATYHLSQLHTPSRDVAAMLWPHLDEPDTWGTHSYETLDAYVTHADPEEALDRLVAMAEKRQQTETLRYHAISNLERLKARDAIEHLLPLVLEPPSVTWGFHDILLAAAFDLKLNPPDLRQYLSVDHADIQTAIAPFVD